MTKPEEKYLIFTLKGAQYALDLAQVAEVDEPPATWPIPGAPPYYQGAMNFHGTIVAVMDLAVFLGLSSGPGAGKVVVLDPSIAALAFLVERVERIVIAAQVELNGQIPHAAPRCCTASLIFENGSTLLLDAVAIAAAATEEIRPE